MTVYWRIVSNDPDAEKLAYTVEVWFSDPAEADAPDATRERSYGPTADVPPEVFDLCREQHESFLEPPRDTHAASDLLADVAFRNFERVAT